MQHYRQLIFRARYFLIPWLLFLIIAGIVLFAYPKAAIHLAINARNNVILDFIMPWVTLGADGWTIVVACLLLLAWNRPAGFFIGLACLLPSTLTWALKWTAFRGEPRPRLYFSTVEKADLHYVLPEWDQLQYDSFPSGHTTVAFAFFFALALCLKNKYWGVFFFLCAIAVGYSRIYLSQHFLLDVYFGSIIGTLITLIIFAEAERRKWITLPIVPRGEK